MRVRRREHVAPKAIFAIAACARGPRGARSGESMKRALVAGLVLAFTAQARGQGGVLLQGVLDIEGWKSDTMSTLLRRNNGDPAGLYRLRLWSAVEPTRGLFVFANVEAEGGNGRRFEGPGTTV